MRTSYEFISWLSTLTISTSFGYLDLLEKRVMCIVLWSPCAFVTITSDASYMYVSVDIVFLQTTWKSQFAAIWCKVSLERRTLKFYICCDRFIYIQTSWNLKCHCDEISHFFFPLFFTQNNFEKWNFLPSAIVQNWFQLSPLFSQRQLYLWRHLPNTRLMIAWFRGISVGFWLNYLRNVCRFRSSIWGKFVWKQKWRLLRVFRG